MRKKYILFISTLICVTAFFFNNSLAQEYLDIESNNIRIDPEWVATNEAIGFSNAYDSKTDKDGNIFTTGYFQNSLITENKTISPQCKLNDSCSDIYFLSKRDNKGNLLWIRYANGNSRPCKIAIDSKGFIYIAGAVYSKELFFTSLDSIIIKLDKPYNYNSGIFICKYDTYGKLIISKFYSEGKSEFPNDLVVDNKDNIYLGGAYQFRNFKKRDEVKNSFLLLKLNSNFEKQWEQKGDTIGSSHINSLFLDLNANIYSTGSFHNKLKLEKTLLINAGYEQNFFVAKFNGKGKLDWATDSLRKFKAGWGSGIVCDKQGNAYVSVNTSESHSFLTKFDSKGKMQWINTIKGNSSNNSQKILIDEKDNIYLAGEGYGAVFGSNSSSFFSYKSHGSIDFYIAKYNSKGECLWLKTGGGKGTDYCKSISIYKNELYAFGIFRNEMIFNQTLIKSNYNAFWLAKFDLKKLELIEKSPQKLIVENEESPNKFNINNISCTCYQYVANQTGFSPTLKTFYSYESFNKITGWKILDSETLFDRVYLKNLQTTSNIFGSFFSFTAVAYKPIRLIHPDNTFTVNITPCTNENKNSELPLNINYEHLIKKHIPDFDVDLFDKSASSYLKLIVKILGRERSEILNKVLFENNLLDIQQFIKNINTKYKTKIKLDSLDQEKSINHIIKEFENKKIDLYTFILNEFILSDNTIHKINTDEKTKMENIFREWFGNSNIDDLDNVIYPRFSSTINTKNINIEISESVIRKWDVLRNKPVKGLNKKYIPTNILSETSSLTYSISNGLDALITNVCTTPTEISGTKILLNFNNAFLIASKTKNDQLLEYSNYPLFVKDSILIPIHDMGVDNITKFTYDSLLTNFTGLLILNATLNIPFKTKVINILSSSIILNNKLIAGSFTIPTQDLSNTTITSSKIKIVADKSIIETSIDELRQHFQNNGIKDIKLAIEKGQLRMNFKKMK